MVEGIPKNLKTMTDTELENQLAILSQRKKNHEETLKKYDTEIEKQKQNMIQANIKMNQLLKSLLEMSEVTGEQGEELAKALQSGPLSEGELQALVQAALGKDTMKKVKEEFKDKSLEETKKIVAQKNDAELSKKISRALWRITSTAAVTGLCIWLAVRSPDSSNEQIQDTEQGIDPDSGKVAPPVKVTNPDDGSITPEKPNTEPPKLLTEKIIEDAISGDLLIEGITHKDVVKAVNSIKNERVRLQVITYLMAGDIFGAQERFGMRKNSSYYSNKATGKLDKLSLYRFVDPMFDLNGTEIASHPDITQDIKNMYQNFLSGTYSNEGNPYIIVSGVDGRGYIFSADHHLINVQVTLSGKQNTAGFYRVIFNNMGIDNSGIEFVPGFMVNGTYYSEGGVNIPLDLMFINIQTGEDRPEGYEGASRIYSVHGTPRHLLAKRVALMERLSRLLANKPSGYMREVQQLIKQTMGCFNVSYFSLFHDLIPAGKKGKGSIFVHT